MKQFLKFLIVIIIISLTILSAFLLYRSKTDTNKTKLTTITSTPTKNVEKIGTCTRTTRLENSPQYDRALSLINQRVSNNVNFWKKYGESAESKKRGFNFFPANITNCIKVIEKNIDNTGAEGYVDFNRKDFSQNYYPIIIDSKYELSDDITTAFLLTHEITHVQQYIYSLNIKNQLSCVDKEVQAFMAQKEFYLTLNIEENSSVYNRMMNETDNFVHPQLKMLRNMLAINHESGCALNFEDNRKCVNNYLKNKLRQIISNDNLYRKECGI
jgi:hypothetical protein